MTKPVTKEIIVKTEAAVVPFAAPAANFNHQDIILPGISLRQNSYRKESLKKYKPGDIFKRPDDEKIADETKGVAFIPVGIAKSYRICDMSKGEAKTVRYESATTDLPYDFVEDGKPMRRDKCFVVHVLFREEMNVQAAMSERVAKGETVDPSDFVLPCRIVFTRSALQAGKVLNTHFEMSKAVRQSPAAMTFILKSVEQKNDKGTWFSYDVQKADKDTKYTPKTAVEVANFWVGSLEKSQYRAHEEETEEVIVTPIGEETF